MKSAKHKVGNLEIGTARTTVGEWWHVYVKGPKEKLKFYIHQGESKAAALATILAGMIRDYSKAHEHKWVGFTPKDKKRNDPKGAWFKCSCKRIMCVPED